MKSQTFEQFGWTLTITGLFGMVAMRMLDESTGAVVMFLGVMLLGLGVAIVDRIDRAIGVLKHLEKHSQVPTDVH